MAANIFADIASGAVKRIDTLLTDGTTYEIWNDSFSSLRIVEIADANINAFDSFADLIPVRRKLARVVRSEGVIYVKPVAGFAIMAWYGDSDTDFGTLVITEAV